MGKKSGFLPFPKKIGSLSENWYFVIGWNIEFFFFQKANEQVKTHLMPILGGKNHKKIGMKPPRPVYSAF